MSTYKNVKFTSKLLMYFALFALLVSGGIFSLSKNQIGADTDYNRIRYKTYDLAAGHRVVAAGMRHSMFNENTDNFFFDDIEYIDPGSWECTDMGLSDTDWCFAVTDKTDWTNASIRANDAKPARIFIEEVLEATKDQGDSANTAVLENMMTHYVLSAWNQWDQVEIADDMIVVESPEFFEAVRDRIDFDEALENYCIPTGHCNVLVDEEGGFVEADIRNSYEGAKTDSIWLAAVDFVLGSVIPEWTRYGVDLSDEREFVENEREKYLIDANRAPVSGDILTLSNPGEIIIDSETGRATHPSRFVIDVNTSAISVSSGKDYKVKLYIKPTDKDSASPAMLFGPIKIPSANFPDSIPYQLSFDWDSDILSGSYDPTPTDPDSAAYNTMFPQSYKATVIVSEYSSSDASDGGTKLEQIGNGFQTLTSINGGTAKGVNSEYFNISASPAALTAGESLSVETEVILQDPDNRTPPLSEINNITINSCEGDASEVIGSDSSSCTNNLGSFNPNEQSLINFSWSTPESQNIGKYTILGKNYSDGYFVGDLDYVEISVTNSGQSYSEDNPPDPGMGGQISFGAKASESHTGSSITSVTDLAHRIFDILVYIIGIISVIAILVGGIMYITSGGDPDKAKKGQKTITYAIVGILVAVMTLIIESAIIDLINRMFTQTPLS